MRENFWKRWLEFHMSLYSWKTRPWLPSRPLVKLGWKTKTTSLFPEISVLFINSTCVRGCPGPIFSGRSRVPLAQKSWYFGCVSGKWGTQVWIPSGWRGYWNYLSQYSDSEREGSFGQLFWLFFISETVVCICTEQKHVHSWQSFTEVPISGEGFREMLLLSRWAGMGISSLSMVCSGDSSL